MLRRRLTTSLAAVVLFLALDASAARHRAAHHPSFTELDIPPADVFSYSEPSKIRVTHVSLDLTADFSQRRLRGTATLSLDNFTGTRTLVLDTNLLTILKVTRDGVATTWNFASGIGDGQPLHIAIEPSTQKVAIEYATSSDAPGLNWNSAAQSYGRQRPYLYSLNEPTDARSWIPLQDTPTVRVTYDATLRVPADLLALMSAENNPARINDSGVYSFRMPRAIPAYLIAVAIGRLEFHSFDERTGVYAEPELMQDAAYELSYLPQMVDVAETIAGPFPFVRHDLLLAPPTFVAGGMEHPMLNFISPMSVVSGNRPAVVDPKNLIAHELAHSWAGDSTTLGSWEDVWLNEGITSYLAVRILEVMQGKERADLQFYLDRSSYANYAAQVTDKAQTILHREVPYAYFGFSSTSYVKGELFIKTLEDRIGRTPFDAFLKAYFQTFAFRWVDHRNFLAFLRARTTFDEDAMQIDEWLYGTGLPSNITAPATSAFFDRVQQRANAFNSGTPIAQLNPQAWTDPEIDLFVQLVNLNASRMTEVDAALGLSLRVTPPLTWLVAAGYNSYAPAMPAIERALLRGGPNGWIPSIYRGLASTNNGRTKAVEIFNHARDRYHDGIAGQVNLILYPPRAEQERNAA
jgi:leukotriene-A4 hydrolase